MNQPFVESPVVPAATILLLRERPRLQVLMVRRHHQIDFASGALVFPGGKVHADDADSAWSSAVTGWSEVDASERAVRVAAIREAFEESGMLVARSAATGLLTDAAHTLEQRAAVDRREISFLNVVRQSGVILDLGALRLFSRWVTPEGVPKRFDTWFYLAVAPEDQLAVCDGREAVHAEWIEPAEALAMGLRGERKLMFPTRLNLKVLAEAGTAEAAMAQAAARPVVTVTPRIKEGPEGPMVYISEDAGYGVTHALLSEDR